MMWYYALSVRRTRLYVYHKSLSFFARSGNVHRGQVRHRADSVSSVGRSTLGVRPAYSYLQSRSRIGSGHGPVMSICACAAGELIVAQLCCVPLCTPSTPARLPVRTCTIMHNVCVLHSSSRRNSNYSTRLEVFTKNHV